MGSRYVKFAQACNCDADPLPSYRTRRVERDEEGWQGLAVVHSIACSKCDKPYREMPVQQVVD